ncbi:MAG: ribbon-helix-helix domain-containing protein, partial [Oculatellaceae cyanobacterium Prado106]|nr:ribbon-helix-helix domain-containing protein [Oculatellaceae cyanobacterium Prado106]
MRETTIYLSEQVGAALDQLAAQTGQSPEMIVTHAVVSYLQAQVHATPPSPNPQASLSLSQRRAFLKLPQEQRRRILQAQAEN